MPGRERDGKPLDEVLSAAEQRVYRELLTGATDEEVAERLDLGVATVRYHIRNSVRRMEVADRDALLALGAPPGMAAAPEAERWSAASGEADAEREAESEWRRESTADGQPEGNGGTEAEPAAAPGQGREKGSGPPRVLLVGLAVVGLLGAAFAGGVLGAWFTADNGAPPAPATDEDAATGGRDSTPQPETTATAVATTPTPPPPTETATATPTPTPEATPRPTPEPTVAATATPVPATPAATVIAEEGGPEWDHPTLTFWGEVPEAEEAFLRARIGEMVAFFDERLGIRVPNLDIHVAASMPALEEALETTLGYETDVSTGQYVGGSLFVHWTTGRRGIERFYVEAFQDQVAGSREKGPWWLTEGVATYAAYRYRDARGQEAYADNYASDLRKAKQVPGPLKHLEQEPWAPGVHGDQNRSLGLVAVDWLLDGAGEDALATYYGALTTNWWERAFEQAFGLSLEETYREFAAYREGTVGIRRAITGRVLGPGGEPIRDWPLFVSAFYTNGSGSHGTSVPDSGLFSVRAPDAAYRIAVSTVCPDSYGQLGWYEEQGGFTTDEQAATVVTVRGEDVDGLVITLPALPDELDPGCRLDR